MGRQDVYATHPTRCGGKTTSCFASSPLRTWGQNQSGDAAANKAIDDSATVKGWMARHRRGKGAPRATSLSEVIADSAQQSREADAAEALPDEQADRVMTDDELARLPEVAEPAGRKAWHMAAALAGLRKGEARPFVRAASCETARPDGNMRSGPAGVTQLARVPAFQAGC